MQKHTRAETASILKTSEGSIYSSELIAVNKIFRGLINKQLIAEDILEAMSTLLQVPKHELPKLLNKSNLEWLRSNYKVPSRSTNSSGYSSQLGPVTNSID